MAQNIKGLTVQIGADTSKLQAAMRAVDSSLKGTQSQLRSFNKALKFDPGNADLIKDKQDALGKQIEDTTNKIKMLKEEQDNLKANGVQEDSTAYKDLQTQIDLASSDLTRLQNEQKQLQPTEIDKLKEAVKNADAEFQKTTESLKSVNEALKLDPKSVELLKDKQRLLNDQVDQTKEKLSLLEQEQKEMDATGVDKNSSAYKDLQTEIDTTKAKLKDLEKQQSSFGSVGAQKIAAVGEQFKDVGGKMADVGGKMTMGFTAPVVAGATAAVSAYGDVDKQFRLVEQTMGTTNNSAKDFQGLWDQMGESAKNSVYGMQDASDALLNFARQGFSAKQATNMLTPAMSLAAGTGTDLSTVTSGLGNSLKMFGADSSEAAGYADVLAKAQAQANTDTTQLFDAMSVAGPICKTVGWNVKDLATVTDIFGNAGISGSEGANALKTGLARLAAPADKGAAAMDELGLSTGQTYAIFNEDGTLKSMPEVLANMQKAFSGLTDQEKLEAASNIFGKNQMAKWLTLMDTSPDEVNGLRDALDDCGGSADDMANALMTGTGGSIEQLKSTFDVLKTDLGEQLAPAFQPVIQAATNLMNGFMNLDDGTKQTILRIVGVVAAIGPLLLVGGKLMIGMGEMMTYAPKIQEGLSAVGGAFKSLAGNPIALVIAAIAAVSVALIGLYKHNETFRDAVNSAWSKIQSVIGTVVEAIKGFWNSTLKPVFQAIGNFCQGTLWPIIQTVWNNISSVVSTVMDAIEGFWDSILKPVFQAIGSFLQNVLWPIMKTVWGAVSSLVSTVFSAISGFWNSILKPVFTAIGNFCQGTLWPIIQVVFMSIKAYVQAAFIVIKGAWNNILKPAFQAIGTFLQGTLGPIFTAIFNGIKTVVSTVFSAISGFWNSVLKPVFQAIGDFCKNILWPVIQVVFMSIQAIVQAVFTVIKGTWDNVLKPVFQAIGNFLKSTLGPVFSTVFDGIKSVVSTVFDAIKGFWDNVLKPVFKAVGNFVKDTLKPAFDTAFNGISTIVSNVFNGIKGFWDGTLKPVFNAIKTACDNLKTAVSGPLNAVKSTFENVFNGIKTFISGKVEWLKGIFNFNWKLPNIKLPHFKIDGKFSLDPPSVPSLGVDWYDKGGIFNSPTVIGVGEKRPEFVGALDDLRGIVREEAGGSARTDALLEQTVTLLTQLVKQGAGVKVEQNIYANETSYSEQQKQATRQFKALARELM